MVRRQLDREIEENQRLAAQAGIHAAALSLVGALTHALTQPREIAAVLGDLLLHCLDAAGLSTGLWYVHDADGALRLHAATGLGKTGPAATETALRHPQLLEPQGGGGPRAFAADTASDPAERALLADLRCRSALVVPFVVRGRHFGSLVLTSDSQQLTETAWGTFGRTLAEQFGQAVALGQTVADRTESTALLHSAVEASPNGLVLMDPTGAIRHVNPQATAIFGYEAAELVGKSIETLLPERARRSHVAERAMFLAAPAVRQLGRGRELVARHKSGREIPVEIGLAPVQRDGQTYVVASVVDITDRRRAEERLRWLSLTVEQAPNIVVLTDPAGNIEYVNPKFTEITGYTAAEVVGKNPRFLQSGSTPPATYRDMWSTILAGKSWHGEFENRRKDGTPYRVAATICAIREHDAAVTHFVALQQDITARRAAEQALREREERLAQIAESIKEVFFVVDAQFRETLYISPAYADIWGRSCQSVYDDPRSFLEPVVPEDRDRMLASIAATQAGHPAQEIEFRVARPDGDVRWVRAHAAPVRNQRGEVYRIVGVAQDITEQRRTEEQFRQAQKMEAVGRLAGGVAHDFNNVLTAIYGYADLLKDELPAGSQALRDLEEIRKGASRAAGLTRQLLAFSRQQVLAPQVLSLVDALDDLEKMLHRLIGEDVELTLQLASGLGNVYADLGQLQQVIMNLVVNSRDAMPQGGKLLIEAANVELTEQYAERHQPVVPGRYVVLAVTDTGTGMTHDVQARLFEPFFTTKEKGKGTGLGLSTVYGIVKQSGGYVWVYSELGRGTTFKIYLPRVDAPAEPVAARREAGSIAGTETILIAEDDELLRPLCRSLLTKLGYTVLEAANASEALELAAKHAGPVHLLVADVVMPEASGRELARRLAESRPDTKVLYVSGYTDDAVVRHGILEPGLHFLQKPFTPAILAQKVREMLDRT